ncbi:MAG TPA: ATP-binding protein [Steroidobacteraceae bacterium]|nr:ATP-binding protein [Steroidobacteraceae bacterium]
MHTLPSTLARHVLEAAPDAMLLVDAAGMVRHANGQVSVLFGYTYEEIVGQRVEALLPERFRARHQAHRRHFHDNVRVRPMGAGLELFGRRRDGSEFPVEISLSPIAENGQLLVAAAIRDITEHKRVEAELIEARRAADAAREAADRASQGKSRFLATASHDLRQPLQTLALLNGALRRRLGSAVAGEVLAQQEQSIGAMSRLLNALLDISKLESGAIQPEPADFTVATLFEELRHEFATSAAAKGLKFDIEPCNDRAHCDPALVGQILRNLVSNAIKYTREGWVRLRCLHEGALIRIEVLDTGIGIPAGQLPHIYEEFFQVTEPSSRARDGYGLGLTIVQRLVRLLDLTLDVHSEVGRGSSFSFQLPAGAAQRVPQPVSATHAPAGSVRHDRARVLLVEDEPAVRDATRMLLEVEEYHVTAVGSLGEALQAARDAGSVDVLITDYHLRGESGLEVIGALRRVLGSSLRAVLMTGDTSSAVKGLPADLNLRVLSKPVDAEVLLQLLDTLLASSAAEAAHTHAAGRGAAHSLAIVSAPGSRR